MSDMMTFPDTWEEFEKLYGFNDAEEIYTNNSRLIPSFRVKQWLDHLPSVQPDVPDRNVGELISREYAIDALKICDNNEDGINCHKCPLRDERWDGAWQDNETNCYRKLMRDSAKLLELQSVAVRMGKWIDYSDEGYVECPFCHSATNCDGNKDELHYCFSCGAELR